MNISEANAVNTVLKWAMGRRDYYGGPAITEQDATQSAQLLAAKARKALMAGVHPEQVQLRTVVTADERDEQRTAQGARELLAVLDEHREAEVFTRPDTPPSVAHDVAYARALGSAQYYLRALLELLGQDVPKADDRPDGGS